LPLNLDMDVLRTLVAAQRLGAFNRAAKFVGRSQSAISQQISKLEERIGQPLFQRHSRNLILTDAGEIVLAYAQRILDLNDEAVAALTGSAMDGTVRFGFPNDFSDDWLPPALGRFRRAHPRVRMEAIVDRNAALSYRLAVGELDLAILLSAEAGPHAEILAHVPMAWIGRPDYKIDENAIVQLAVLDAPCAFRSCAIEALNQHGMAWEIPFVTRSLSGLWAAIDAGLGITVRTAESVPAHLKVLEPALNFPPLPSAYLSLSSAGRPLSMASERLRDILLETMPPKLRMLAHNADPSFATDAELEALDSGRLE
jgi:DNA-binding transcriptional LysR family regulator